MKFKTQLFDEIAVKRAMTRLSYEIIERSPVLTNVVLIGIKTRGVPLAKIIKGNVLLNAGIDLPLYELDITYYRDDREGEPEVIADLKKEQGRNTRRRRIVYGQDDPRRDRRGFVGRQGEQHKTRGSDRPRTPRTAHSCGLRRQKRSVIYERENSGTFKRNRRRHFRQHLRYSRLTHTKKPGKRKIAFSRFFTARFSDLRIFYVISGK